MNALRQVLYYSVLGIFLGMIGAPASAAPPSREKLFREGILPILRENCLGCHGAERVAGLDMRTASSLRKGGMHGAVIVPGNPNQSRLFRYVSGRASLQMPPGKRLAPQEVAVLREWIAAGANWPANVTASDALPWAFRKPVRSALPKVKNRTWARTPIDLFILSKLEARGLKPAPPADKLTLLRRVTFDLTGLPPMPAEVDAFLNDHSPNAYEKVVDRLLASPRYGERWARHWLDLARYAESEGFKSDEIRPNAWRYRDYVITAFNTDKPYDRFIREQIAGDELYPDSPEALVATGFNRHFADESNATNLWQRRQDILNDITDTVGSSILGLTVGCARCHNHKYDPIPQKDYYRLQAFFAAVRLQDNTPLLTPAQKATYQTQLRAWEEKTRDMRSAIAKLEAPYREKFFRDRKKRFAPDVQAAIETAPEKRTPLQWILYYKGLPQLEMGPIDVKAMKPEEQKTWQEYQKELQKFASLKPVPPVACTITDVGPGAPKTHTLAVGVYNAPLEETPPGYLSLLNSAPATIRPPRAGTTGRRTALAKWLTSPDNPLTTRVIVNRLWQHHFGRGIVGTPNDFGAMSEKPTHPELLDWLAATFVANDKRSVINDKQKNKNLSLIIHHSSFGCAWSLKRLHRLMVTSSAYRQSTAYDSKAARSDPENRLLWRFSRKRLEGEAIRDAMLAVSGELNPKMGGPSVFPELPAGITTRGNWQDTKDPQEHNRRSIYVFVKRNLRYPFFAAFDMPDTHEPCGRRLVTTTPTQALFLLNDAFTLQAAPAFAERLQKEAGANQYAQVGLAYRLAFSRPPEAEEQRQAIEFLEYQSRAFPDAALIDFCHALLNAHEFVYTE